MMLTQLRGLFAVTSACSVVAVSAAQTCTPSWWASVNGLLPIGNQPPIGRAFAEFDRDGPGPLSREFFVAGFFTFSGNIRNSASIARWDGLVWTGVDTGLGGSGLDQVLDLAVWDRDGSGPGEPVLIAVGAFFTAGGEAVNGVGMWDGERWSGVGGGLDLFGFTAVAHDFDGDGPQPPQLVVGGRFNRAGDVTARSIARFDGQNWFPLGGMGTNVTDLASFDPDGAGPAAPILFGKFSDFSQGLIMRLVGTQWEWSGGLAGDSQLLSSFLEVDHDGPGPEPKRLYVTGNSLAYWNNSGWTTVLNFVGESAASFDPDGPGPARTLVVTSRGAALLTFDGLVERTIAPPSVSNGWQNTWGMGSFDPDGPGPLTPSLFVSFENLPANAFSGVARYGCTIEWARCFADTSQDLLVSMPDITTVLANWATDDPVADANNDGVVGLTDITGVLLTFSEDCRAPDNAARVRPPFSFEDDDVASFTRRLAEWPLNNVNENER
jgi:hypothetical protein